MQNLQRGPVDLDPGRCPAGVVVLVSVDTDLGSTSRWDLFEDVLAMSAIESAVSVRDADAKRCGDI